MAISSPSTTNLTEVPEAFRPTEWLSEVIPRKAPYYPQMGDEVIYFRQGHQFYLSAVRAKNVYEVGPRSEPWARQKIRVSMYSVHYSQASFRAYFFFLLRAFPQYSRYPHHKGILLIMLFYSIHCSLCSCDKLSFPPFSIFSFLLSYY